MTPLRLTASLLLALASITCQTQEIAALDDFVTRHGDHLDIGGEKFRFVSWNVPNLHLLEDSFDFLGDSPWRWPNEFEVRDALRSVRQMGGTVVRPYVISVRRDDGDMGPHVHVLGPGQFNEEAFAALDLVLKTAQEEGVRVIIPLVDNWKWWGGIEQYAAFRGKTAEEFWTDQQLIDDFKQTIKFIVNRRNTITGRLYRDDPTIFGWETGNELDAPPAWTRQIAAYIKQLDPNHLVIDGRSLHGVPVASLDDPNIDVITTHHYPNVGNNNAASIREAVEQVDGRKAYFVGEFGFVAVDEAQRMLDAVDELGVSGASTGACDPTVVRGAFTGITSPRAGTCTRRTTGPGLRRGKSTARTRFSPCYATQLTGYAGSRFPRCPRPRRRRCSRSTTLPISPGRGRRARGRTISSDRLPITVHGRRSARTSATPPCSTVPCSPTLPLRSAARIITGLLPGMNRENQRRPVSLVPCW